MSPSYEIFMLFNDIDILWKKKINVAPEDLQFPIARLGIPQVI